MGYGVSYGLNEAVLLLLEPVSESERAELPDSDNKKYVRIGDRELGNHIEDGEKWIKELYEDIEDQ